jgi:hypothetical protein
MEVDNGMSEVAPVDSDGAIDVDEGAAVELAMVVPVCDGAICVSKEGPGGFAGRGFDFLSNPFESIDMFDNRSAASSLSSEPPPPPPPTSFTPPDLSFTSLLASLDMATAPALPADPGLLPSPSILLIPNANLSNMGLDPNDPDGDGSGWELCMDIDSERGV